MRNEFLNEIGDSIFAIAMGAAIGLAATNLAIQITHERVALDAASFGHENDSTTMSEGARRDISPAG